MSFEEQEPKFRIPSLRRSLIKLHSDLFTIDRLVQPYSAYYPESLTPLEKLILLLEDRRFLNHWGVDYRSVFREVFKAITFRKHGGASTIDMQFVRTATGYKERKFKRKLYEILLAVIIQFRYSKIVILRSYIYCAFFGSKLKGANAASRKLYGKSPNELSVDEAAIIAAMLVYPRPISPSADWYSKVQRRANYGKRIYVTHKNSFK